MAESEKHTEVPEVAEADSKRQASPPAEPSSALATSPAEEKTAKPSYLSKLLFGNFDWEITTAERHHLAIAVFALIYAGLVISLLANRNGDWFLPYASVHLCIWTLCPPIFMFCQWRLNPDPDPSASFKYNQDLATKVWAAVVATIIYLIPGGPMDKLGGKEKHFGPPETAAAAKLAKEAVIRATKLKKLTADESALRPSPPSQN